MTPKAHPHIISASRRTDIPAFYTSWFLERLKAGYVLVPNPLNPRQASHVSLRPVDVAGIVFWSKNPRPLLPHLPELDRLGFSYYLQFTITAYPRDLEPRTPSWAELVDTFRRVSERVGPSRVVWRYDPIILSDVLDAGYHLEQVERTAEALQGAGARLVISFLDLYRKTKRNLATTASPLLRGLAANPDGETMRSLAAGIAACVSPYGFQVEACAESIDLASCGVRRGRCIDPTLLGIDDLAAFAKDAGQREECGCAKSRDIGMYDSCLHGCAFCYANSSDAKAIRNRRLLHCVTAECLLGDADSRTSAPGAKAGMRTAPERKEAVQLSLDGVGEESRTVDA